MKTLTYLHFCVLFIKTCEMALQCKMIKSINGKYLRRHVISTYPAKGPVYCPTICEKHFNCKSWNFWLDDKTCELNDADRFTQPKDYEEGVRVIYSDTPNSAPSAVSLLSHKLLFAFFLFIVLHYTDALSTSAPVPHCFLFQ